MCKRLRIGASPRSLVTFLLARSLRPGHARDQSRRGTVISFGAYCAGARRSSTVSARRCGSSLRDQRAVSVTGCVVQGRFPPLEMYVLWNVITAVLADLASCPVTVTS